MSKFCKGCHCDKTVVIDEFPVQVCMADNHIIRGKYEEAQCVFYTDAENDYADSVASNDSSV